MGVLITESRPICPWILTLLEKSSLGALISTILNSLTKTSKHYTVKPPLLYQ